MKIRSFIFLIVIALGSFPGLKSEGRKGDPLILMGKGFNKIVWMPLIFHAEKQAVMWVGTVVITRQGLNWRLRQEG